MPSVIVKQRSTQMEYSVRCFTQNFGAPKEENHRNINELEWSVDVPSILHWDVFFKLLINLTLLYGFSRAYFPSL